MMGHKPWLQTSIPVEATGSGGSRLPEDDLVYKYFRLKGCTCCIIFAYFEHSVGLVGANLDMCNKIDAIRDGGRIKIMVAADFNVKPEAWNASQILGRLDVQVILPQNTQATCRAFMLDYLVVSGSIAPNAASQEPADAQASVTPRVASAAAVASR